jgi:hypothetical protein
VRQWAGFSEVRDVLDFGQPVGLILVGILHLMPDEDKPAQVVAARRHEGDDGAPHPRPAEVNCYGGVGRKPTA